MSFPDAHNDPASEAAASADALPDRIAGRYRIEALLGRGGFGAVYKAYDDLEDRWVALKVIRRDASLDPRSGTRSSAEAMGSSPPSSVSPSVATRSRASPPRVRRSSVTHSFGASNVSAISNLTEAFKDEFRLLTQLHHPNLAAVYDFGRCDEQDGVYFTQELLTGDSLSEFLKGAGRETIVEIFLQIARALDYIHTLGLVHEDIKPSNVIVCPPETAEGQPQAKLIDFGLARVLRGPQPSEVIDDPDVVMVLGTPGFSAPEKVRGQATDSRSDVYSLAATLYTAIRGQRPFPSRNFREALRGQRDWRPELAGALLSKAGPVVAELIGRMLEPDPNLRPQSARSIVLELLRRESAHIRDRQESAQDRREFARVLVEHLPFVDRADHLDILLKRALRILRPDVTVELRAIRHRVIRSVIVEAPEGMGKQRLMAELRREIQLGDGLFVEGTCWSSDGTTLGAFAPVVMQLATALGERSKVLRQHAELITAVRERHNDAAANITEFLIECSREHPFVLHLSDLARGQEFMRTKVEQLVRAIDHSEARILLCITTPPQNRIKNMLAALNREQLAELWSLRPFDRDEMRDVLLGILGETTSQEDIVDMLEKLTGGHPLSFRETLRVLIEESILTRDSDSWVLRASSVAAEQLHKSLAQRSESRLDSLGVSAWEIASVLYLVEAPIAEDNLAELSDLRRERFRRTLDRLEGEGLVTRTSAVGVSVVSLAHQSVREAVRIRYEDSLDETRIDLAERIEELEERDAKLVFLRARLVDDAAESLESVDVLEEATDFLLKVNQPQLAGQVLERLISRLRRHGGVACLPRLLKAQLTLLENVAGALHDARREAAHYEAGILVAELLADYRAQSLFWLGLVDRYTIAEHNQDTELALTRLDRATETAKRARDRILELRIATRRAEVLIGAGEIEQAMRCTREAMEIIDYHEAEDVHVCHAIGVRLRCLSVAGEMDEARRLHDMAKPVAARVSVLQRLPYLSGIAFLAVLGGDPARAIPEMHEAVDQLKTANISRLLITPLHNLGDLQLRSGDLEAAARAFDEAARLGALHGNDDQVMLNRGFLGYTRARMGEVAEGAAMVADAKARIIQSHGEHVSQQQLRLLDAEVAHMMGQSPRARRELEEMLADFHSQNELSLAQWAQDALLRIERDRGTSFIETPEIVADGPSDPDMDTVRTQPVR
ncbi:MAG: serine/threonine-protein kinase [Nannocystaceae bacterium]|nr:protein kinase [Myxococcales bacterium]